MWLSEKEFLKQAGAPKLSKPINVDKDPQPSAATQTHGMLYGEDIFETAAKREPILACPNCGTTATSFTAAKALYQVEVKESNGKFHMADLPPCPVQGVAIPYPVYLYSLTPCGCKVTQEWASAFSQELQGRLQLTYIPRAVVAMTEQRQAKLLQLQNALTKLYQHQAKVTAKTDRDLCDYWIVVVADSIGRLCPGSHNIVPSPKQLSNEAKTWAQRHGYLQPNSLVAGESSPQLTDPYFGYGPSVKLPKGMGKPNDALDALAHALSAFGVGAKELEKLADEAVSTVTGKTKIKKPTLQTLPVEVQQDSPFNIIGGTKEEVEAYEKAQKKVVQGPKQEEPPQEAVAHVANLFKTAPLVVTYLIKTEIAPHYTDDEVAHLQKHLEASLGMHLKHGSALSEVARKLISAYISLSGKQVTELPPASAAPAPVPIERHARKRRTIRHVDE